jgi:hypothetical protein
MCAPRRAACGPAFRAVHARGPAPVAMHAAEMPLRDRVQAVLPAYETDGLSTRTVSAILLKLPQPPYRSDKPEG